MNEKKVLSYLGLCKKAGQLVSGEFMTINAIKDGSAKLVIVGTDVSDNSLKKVKDKCDYYHVPYILMSNKETLGHSIGSEIRAMIAILNDGFAKAIMNCLNDGGN